MASLLVAGKSIWNKILFDEIQPVKYGLEILILAMEIEKLIYICM